MAWCSLVYSPFDNCEKGKLVMWVLVVLNVLLNPCKVGAKGKISIANALKKEQYWSCDPSPPFFLLLGDDSFVL